MDTTDNHQRQLPKGRRAVVDIGSNSVRLVVYHGPTRTPLQIFNERVLCGLGRGLRKTGRLDPQGVVMALDSLARFVLLGNSMAVENFDVLATAAVRDAADGQDFTDEIKRRFGLKTQVLSGEQEAKMAANGVVSGWPQADGIMGDLGGGSLDLVVLNEGSFGAHGTLPLGMIYLAEACDGKLNKAKKIIDEELDRLPWLKEGAGRAFYPVGGSWRALSKVFMSLTEYPLHIVDNYTLPADQALTLSRRVARMDIDDLSGITWVSNRRKQIVPLAALLLRRLIKRTEPEKLVFSVQGMREGFFFQSLPKNIRRQDPLIRACSAVGQREARFAVDGQELVDMMAGVFADESPESKRLRIAACHLSDIAWREHPEYRAEQALHRVLKLPVAGLTHDQRVRLALMIFIRYNGDLDMPLSTQVRSIISDRQEQQAKQVGLALRLATTLSGGVPGMLRESTLDYTGNTLILRTAQGESTLVSEAVRARLQSLAKALGVKGWMVNQ